MTALHRLKKQAHIVKVILGLHMLRAKNIVLLCAFLEFFTFLSSFSRPRIIRTHDDQILSDPRTVLLAD
jgi:hypothetical protein